MSRWSSPYRVLLLAAALGLGCLAALAAQGSAVLRAGPNPARGVPYLSPNALRGFRGAYLIGPQEPEVEVLYTREPLVFPTDWAATRCGSLPFLVVVGQEDYTLCYAEEGGYTLFFQFPGLEPVRSAAPPKDACAFAESFVRRFQILLGLIGAGREPPFPAILRLPG